MDAWSVARPLRGGVGVKRQRGWRQVKRRIDADVDVGGRCDVGVGVDIDIDETDEKVEAETKTAAIMVMSKPVKRMTSDGSSWLSD